VNDGTVFAAGHPDEIVQNEAVREVYLGKDFRL
jgi:lipopolysaccharide export system ATP-binding protein